ncbi:MAG: hypothetical protein Q9227_003775 [Pyrenula ochraceoflavens]
MSHSRVAIVTGANKGIGLAIIRQLALQYPTSPLNTPPSTPFLIYLTSRSPARGQDALASLSADPQLLKAKALKEHGGLTQVEWHGLDISKTSSVREFAGWVRERHGDGGVDVVVNNAGVAMDGFDANIVKTTLESNYYGTLESSQTLLPLLRPRTGRLINVASIAGLLRQYSPSIRDRFLSAASNSSGRGVPETTALMEEFKEVVNKGVGKEREAGWPSSAYMVSKAGIISATAALAREEEKKGGGRLINSCCPGYVKTVLVKDRMADMWV